MRKSFSYREFQIIIMEEMKGLESHCFVSPHKVFHSADKSLRWKADGKCPGVETGCSPRSPTDGSQHHPNVMHTRWAPPQGQAG